MKMKEADNFDDMLNTLRSTEPYLADDGFSSAIIARLPEARQLPGWLSNLILLGFTAVASAIVAWQLPVMKLTSFPVSSLISLPVLGTASVSTFVLSYIIIWMAQNETI
jgi:hypothetical protein